jgi:hypothetical protein
MTVQSYALSEKAYLGMRRTRERTLDQVPSWAVFPVLILLAYLPYAEMLHDYLHYQLFGFAAEVTVVPTALLFVIFLLIAMFRKPMLLVYMVLFLVLMAIVLVTRYWWGLDLSWNDSVRQAVGLRYMILIPMYILLASYILQPKVRVKEIATRIIIVNGTIAALVGILYVAGLIVYRVVPEGSDIDALYATGEVGRASGLSSGVNFYSNFLVLAIVAACFVYQRSAVIKTVTISVLILGILTSQSRWPLMSTAIVLGSVALLNERSRNKKRLLLVSLCVFIGLGGVYYATDSGTMIVEGAQGRISQGMGEDLGLRQSKYEIGLRAVFENTYTVLAGATPKNLIQGYSAEYIFSDNGILSMFITAGIPVTLIFIFFCFRLGRVFSPGRRTLTIFVFGVIALGTLFFNNAIYWDSWLLHSAVVCFLILGRPLEDESLPEKPEQEPLPLNIQRPPLGLRS